MGKMKDLAIHQENEELCGYWQELDVEYDDGHSSSHEYCKFAKSICACSADSKECLFIERQQKTVREFSAKYVEWAFRGLGL